MSFNPANPWSLNAFDPPGGDVKAPSPHTRTPKLLPDVDRLFALQRNLLKVLNGLPDGKDFHQVRADAENAYRNINGYLREYATDGLGQ
jgi:hypothetical protein